MKRYLFSYVNVYGERMYVLSSGKNRADARATINFPVTYRGLATMSLEHYRDVYGAVFYL